MENTSMWNIKKYSAMAIAGAGLAFAAASPASACGAFGMAGWPVFGAAFGGCGAYGFAAPVAYAYVRPVVPVAYGCAPVAFGCGGFGSYGYAPTFGYAPTYGAYGYGGCGCGHFGYHARAFGYAVAFHRPIVYGMAFHRPIGYAVAFHRPIGYGVAFHRPIGYGVAFHRPMRTYASYRSYRPSRYAAYTTRSYHRSIYASYGMKHHYAMRHGARTERA
jgi:hypothetical protein